MEFFLIINRYLFREILYNLLALTALLLLIYVSHRFMAYLVQASTGILPAAFIFQLLALRLLTDLMLILPLSFFLALLLALGRLYKDNEITALAACGIPMPTRGIFISSFIFAGFIGLLSLILAPWAENQRDVLITRLQTVAEVGGIAAGRFKEFSQGKGTFYVEKLDNNTNTMHTLFVQVNLPNKRITIVAKQGYQIMVKGELYLVLVDGRRYESPVGKLNYTITQFSEHHLRIPKKIDNHHGENPTALPTWSLFQQTAPIYQAELQWRFSLPIMVILLAGLAIPLSHTTPRQSHYFKIVLGILIYLIYNNLLSIVKRWLEREEISPWLGMGWVHLGLLLIILILFNFSQLKLQYRYWVSRWVALRKR